MDPNQLFTISSIYNDYYVQISRTSFSAELLIISRFTTRSWIFQELFSKVAFIYCLKTNVCEVALHSLKKITFPEMRCVIIPASKEQFLPDRSSYFVELIM